MGSRGIGWEMIREHDIWKEGRKGVRCLLAVAGMFSFSMFWFWLYSLTHGVLEKRMSEDSCEIVSIVWFCGWSFGNLLIGSCLVSAVDRRSFAISLFWVITTFAVTLGLGASRPDPKAASFQIALISGAGLARLLLERKGLLER